MSVSAEPGIDTVTAETEVFKLLALTEFRGNADQVDKLYLGRSEIDIFEAII